MISSLVIQAVMNILNIDILMIQAIMKGSTAARKGLKRGDQVESLLHLLPSIMIQISNIWKLSSMNYDQILDVNGESFQHVMTLERAVEILTKQTLLQVNKQTK